MKRISVLIILSGLFLSTTAQKVDLDKFSFTANYRLLPRMALDSSYHTFDVQVKSGTLVRMNFKEGELPAMVNIAGWKRLNERAHITVQVKLEDVLIEKTELQQRDDIQRDKNGKEIGRRSWYFQVITYSFASQASVIDYKGNAITTIPLASRDYKQTFKGTEFASPAEANIDFKYSQSLMQNQIVRQTATNSLNSLNNILTGNFGYQETTVNDFLWILNTRKNPENDRYHQAWLDFRQAMFSMTADQSLDKVREQMQPAIDYFNSIKKKYRSDSKSDRKMRYASYYNLSKIYYYLDDPDAALAEAAALQVNDFDDKDGRYLESAASDLKMQLKLSQIHSRHFALHPETFTGPYDVVSSSSFY